MLFPSTRMRRSRFGKSAPPNGGRPEPKWDRPFPIERPVAWGVGFSLTLTRLMRLRDWWLCLWSRVHRMLRKVLLIIQDNVIARNTRATKRVTRRGGQAIESRISRFRHGHSFRAGIDQGCRLDRVRPIYRCRG